MSQVLFSIVVPVYNVQDYLKDSVLSVINQHYKSCEVILVDDGSTDNSGPICDQLAAQYSNVEVVHQKNGGLSAARNTGIKSSSGEYLVFLDSDDLLYDNSLENLENAILEQEKPNFIISRRCTVRDGSMIPCKYHFDDKIRASNNSARIYEQLQGYPDCWLGTWIFSVNRSYCLEHNLLFYNGILHEDEEWVPRLFFNAKSIGFNNDILYCNRIAREGSITATLNIKREFDKLKILDLLHKEFTSKAYGDDACLAVEKRMEQIFFGVLCEAYLYRKDNQYQKLIQMISKHRNYLKNAHREIYRLVNCFLNSIGIKATCWLLNILDYVKKSI